MTSLTGPSRAAASGMADSLVVFLHGYGADGDDLIGLAEPLAPHLPNTRFLAPNAPQRCVNNPSATSGFRSPGSTAPPRRWRGPRLRPSRRSTAGSTRWRWNAARGGTVLVGFSQGTMMALHVGLRRRAPFAGIVGFSGRLLEPGGCPAEITVAAAGAARARRPGPDGAVREPRRGRAGAAGGRGRGRHPCVRAGSGHASRRTGSGWHSASSGAASGSIRQQRAHEALTTRSRSPRGCGRRR